MNRRIKNQKEKIITQIHTALSMMKKTKMRRKKNDAQSHTMEINIFTVNEKIKNLHDARANNMLIHNFCYLPSEFN